MKQTPETERRYKLAIYELPYDTNYRANYQVWKTVKILKEHMERFERERDEAREQRDRLAEALRKAISWGDSASHHILYRQNINWTYLNEAREALQSLNQPTQ